jgi:hypothetical protein
MTAVRLSLFAEYLSWSHKIEAFKCWATRITIKVTNEIYSQKVVFRNNCFILWSNNNLLRCNVKLVKLHQYFTSDCQTHIQINTLDMIKIK